MGAEGEQRGDEDPDREASGSPRLRGVAAGLFATNLGVFAAQVALAGHPGYALAMPDGILRRLGANASLWTIADDRFETLVTSCFLHGNVLHLIFNLAVLWQVGPLLERTIGAARFFPLYLASGVVGSAASAIWGRFFGQTVSVGASGALCGLIAAAMVVGFRSGGWKSELARGMGRWLALIVVIGVVRTFRRDIAQIDNAAHLGGAATGAILALVWERGVAYGARATRVIVAVCCAIVVLSPAAVYARNKLDPFVFMDVDERVDAARDAYAVGDCARARGAIARAAKMDPRDEVVRARAIEIDLTCTDRRGAPRSMVGDPLDAR